MLVSYNSHTNDELRLLKKVFPKCQQEVLLTFDHDFYDVSNLFLIILTWYLHEHGKGLFIMIYVSMYCYHT